MRELFNFIKECLSSTGDASYTRCAGFTTLYFYLLWATYKISGGAAIKDIDIPITLAAFLFGLYGLGKVADTVIAVKGATNANQPPPAP